MANSKKTKNALIASVVSLTMCTAMLAGSTYAWFTDSVSAGVNKVVSGTLDIDLVDGAGTSLEGTTLDFAKADGAPADEKIIWEPGCTYKLPEAKIVNNGNLALKYKINVSGISGSAKLLDVIEWTVKVDGEEIPLDEFEGHLAADESSSVPFELVGHMKETAGNEYQGLTATGISINVTAAQDTVEYDSFNNTYDENAEYAVSVSNAAELKAAFKEGKNVSLDSNITIGKTTLTNDIVIDLNGHTLTGSTTGNVDCLLVKDADITVKNGTLAAPAVKASGSTALYAEGASNITIENCELKTNSNQSIVVCTNGSNSKDTKIAIKNSTISAPTVTGKKGYAAYIPAGDVTFENCDVTGHVFICGGNVTLDGGTYTATGFNGQSKIWNKDDTISYVKSISGGNALSMGDSILIYDRRDGYDLSSVTIKNIDFNTEISLSDSSKAVAYAIKYVDSGDSTKEMTDLTIENCIYNNQIDGSDPTMFVDFDGNDVTLK